MRRISGFTMLEILVTILVVLLMLLHMRTSILISASLPLSVLLCFIAMSLIGVDANVVALSGIAIAIGTMVDMGIIILENVYGSLADWEATGSPGGEKQRLKVIRESAAERISVIRDLRSTPSDRFRHAPR